MSGSYFNMPVISLQLPKITYIKQPQSATKTLLFREGVIVHNSLVIFLLKFREGVIDHNSFTVPPLYPSGFSMRRIRPTRPQKHPIPVFFSLFFLIFFFFFIYTIPIFSISDLRRDSDLAINHATHQIQLR